MISLNEEQQNTLENELRKVSDRLTIERLSDRLPALKDLIDLNRLLIRGLNNGVVLFTQKNDVLIAIDEETGRTKSGQTREEALAEVNDYLNTLVQLSARYL